MTDLLFVVETQDVPRPASAHPEKYWIDVREKTESGKGRLSRIAT